MKYPPVPLWKEAPFIRYIVPFAGGITGQWHRPVPLYLLACGAGVCCILVLLPGAGTLRLRFRFSTVSGAGIYLLLLFTGALLVYLNDARNHPYWVGHSAADAPCWLAVVEAPLSEKAKTYKATVTIKRAVTQQGTRRASGRMILYFPKDSSTLRIGQGSRLLVNAPLRPIAGFTNATDFDYPAYCALQNIYHQAFLKKGSYLLLEGNDSGPVGRLLGFLRDHTLHTLRRYIKGQRESGMAEALLIGYKEDLDKRLVQSYSNTGVVHVIAISGLHVGLIYTILSGALQWLPSRSHTRWIKPLLLLAGLWLFSLLAGGSPSVLRSAVMFSGIVLGNCLGRRSSTCNSLAASAFLLLCYNPLWLFDAGCQLSYLAVLSLVLFGKPFYQALIVENKLLDMVWRLASVTLAAQVLTVPVCLYYFRQFPNFFLLTNMVAVPLSSLILLMEIALCVFSVYPPLAVCTGHLTERLIFLLNSFIAYMETMPYALSKNLAVSAYQVVLLYGIIFFTGSLVKARIEKARAGT